MGRRTLASGRLTFGDDEIVDRRHRGERDSACSTSLGTPTSRGSTISPARCSTPRGGTGTTTSPASAVAVIGGAASAIQLVPEIAKTSGSCTCSSARPTGCSPRRTGPTPRSTRGFRADPAAVQAFRDEIFAAHRPLHHVPGRGPTGDGAPGVPARDGGGGGSRGAGEATPDTPYGCNRPLMSNVLLPDVQPPERRTRHRHDRADHADGHRHRRRHRARGRHDRLRHRLRTTKLPRRPSTSSAATACASPTSGPTARRRTSASPSAGFPNLFVLYGPNTNNGSIIYMIESQVDYVMRQIERIDRERLGVDRRAPRRAGRPTTSAPARLDRGRARGRAGAAPTTARRRDASSRSGRTP